MIQSDQLPTLLKPGMVVSHRSRWLCYVQTHDTNQQGAELVLRPFVGQSPVREDDSPFKASYSDLKSVLVDIDFSPEKQENHE
jgi:hypothetical protein